MNYQNIKTASAEIAEYAKRGVLVHRYNTNFTDGYFGVGALVSNAVRDAEERQVTCYMGIGLIAHEYRNYFDGVRLSKYKSHARGLLIKLSAEYGEKMADSIMYAIFDMYYPHGSYISRAWAGRDAHGMDSIIVRRTDGHRVAQHD